MVTGILIAACCLTLAAHGKRPHMEVDAGTSLHIMLSVSLAAAGGIPGVPAELNFGEIYTKNAPNTVTLSPTGVRTSADPSTMGGSASVMPAEFLITGTANATFNIILPGTVTLSNGAAVLTVTDFTQSLGSTPILDANGQALFGVGATLHIGANQPTGQYTGVFEVNVTYQ